MHCSNLNFHVFELHVIDDPLCFCGTGVEDSEHFFMKCPLYHTSRQRLIQIITDISVFNIDVLLFGDENLDIEQNCVIFDAVHEYILQSERFK